MGFNKVLKPWQFVEQFNEKIDMSKTDRFPKKFKTFKGVDIFYVYLTEDKITNKKSKEKYRLTMAIRKRDGEFYMRSLV